MAKQFFITGIGTDVGKTVVSAILTQAFQGAYLKPVQAGDLNYTDSDKIREWAQGCTVLPEFIQLTHAMSPHAAAKRDKVEIDPQQWEIPNTELTLIIEGAGGLNVPLSSNHLIADWLEKEKIPTIVVSRHYLGSINHTLLTLEVLRQREIPVEGVIFVGDQNVDTEEVITNLGKTNPIYRLPMSDNINQQFVLEQALEIQKTPWFQTKIG